MVFLRLEKRGIMKFQALIFDFDGLMIESETIALRVWKEVVASLGSEMEEGINRLLIGKSPSAGAAIVKQVLNLSIDASELQRIYWEERTIQMCREATPVDGLEALVLYLLELGMRLAVASNSPTNYLRQVLQAIDLDHYFEVVVGSDQVPAGKPAPDVYLETARRLDIHAASTLALEDSPDGIAAAIAAGMTCYAIPNPGLAGGDFSQAHQQFGSMEALHSHLLRTLTA
jgi:beta-phosphoglucomutase-like phosphatase (HAD superfamily)